MTDKPKKRPQDLRSQQWFGRQDRDGFAYRSWVKGKGVPHDQFDGRPVIGICNTFSELTPCNSHFRTLAEQVKIGVYEAGGFPLEFPVMTGNSRGKPPASYTPILTCSAKVRKWELQGVSSLKVLQMPMTGRPSNWSCGTPLPLTQLR